MNDRERPLRGIVDLWSLDVTVASGDLQDLKAAQEVVVGAGAAILGRLTPFETKWLSLPKSGWYCSAVDCPARQQAHRS